MVSEKYTCSKQGCVNEVTNNLNKKLHNHNYCKTHKDEAREKSRLKKLNENYPKTMG